jgi:hypothetical protein
LPLYQTGFFSFWVKPTDLDGGVALLYNGRDDSDNYGIKIYILSTGYLRINQRSNDTEDRIDATTTQISINNEYHVVVGTNGSSYLMWVNGTSQSLSVSQGANNGDWLGDCTTTSANHLVFGTIWNLSGKNNPYDGIMDEIAYFSATTPTQAIVDSIYNSDLTSDISAMNGIAAYYRFEEGLGQSVADLIGTFDLVLGTDNGAATDDPTWTASPFDWITSNPGLRLSVNDSTFEINSNELSLKSSSITTAKIADGSITWEKLISSLQASIGGLLYDYQDPTINSKLQMHVRWSSYLIEKYFNVSDTSLHFTYDQSDTLYEHDRRALWNYIELLKTLHEKTNRTAYFDRLLYYYNILRAGRISVEHDDTPGRYTYTYDIHPNSEWVRWFQTDADVYLIQYYIYEQDPTIYASYLTEVKDFADVVYSYITKAGITGWGWGYRWNQAAIVAGVVNTSTPAFKFYSKLKAENITTTDITTTATYDTLMDSVYAYVNTAWLTDGGTGGGGWEYTVGDASISRNYQHINTVNMMVGAETLSDTSYLSGLNVKLQKVLNYLVYDNGGNYNQMQRTFIPGTSLLVKWGQEYGDITFPNDSTASAYVANFLYPAPFIGNTYDGNSIITASRRAITWLLYYLDKHIAYFNDNAYTESYLEKESHLATGGWSTNATAYYSADGQYIYQRYGVGASADASGTEGGVVYYRHGDSTPTSPDPDTCNYNAATRILDFTIPQSGTLSNGLTYKVYKRMGSPILKVVPSAPDSVWMLLDDTGDTVGDSTYIFYYTTGGVLDTMRNTEIAVGDSFQINPSLGVFANLVRTAGPTDGYSGSGFVCNGSSAYLRAHSDAAGYKVYSLSKTTLADSAMFFTPYHLQGNFYLYDASDWSNTLDAAQDVLEAMQKVWQNGLAYEGILEDKTQ